jgi:hypothetical protein
MDIEAAVIEGWRSEIKSDVLSALADLVKNGTEVLSEGWLPIGTEHLDYAVVADGESLMAYVYETEDWLETDEEPIKSFQIHLYVTEGPR